MNFGKDYEEAFGSDLIDEMEGRRSIPIDKDSSLIKIDVGRK